MMPSEMMDHWTVMFVEFRMDKSLFELHRAEMWSAITLDAMLKSNASPPPSAIAWADKGGPKVVPLGLLKVPELENVLFPPVGVILVMTLFATYKSPASLKARPLILLNPVANVLSTPPGVISTMLCGP